MALNAASRFNPVALVAGLLLLAGCTTSSDVLQTRGPTPVISSAKYAAIVVDANSGGILYETSADQRRYPASLTKMMTLYMLFSALESGRVSMTTELPVSSRAASQVPTKMGLKPGQSIAVSSAIPALATKSANDVAVAVAEYLGGSEQGFAAMMTSTAQRLGMRGTQFRNASGLHDAGQFTTARDMAVLGMALRRDFPQYYGYFSARQFAFNGRTVRGHNRLIGNVQGVDGIKTGYVRASGFNLVTSVNRDGRKLVAVVMGGPTAKTRDDQMEELIARYMPAASRGRVAVAGVE